MRNDWKFAGLAGSLLALAGCGGGGSDTADSTGGAATPTVSPPSPSTQFSAASYTGAKLSAVTATSAAFKADFATVASNMLTVDGNRYPLTTLADATVIPTGLSQATDGSGASIECRGTLDAYVLFAQSAAGTPVAAGGDADLAGKSFQEYECIGGVATKGGLLTFDGTGSTVLTVVKNGATLRANVPTSQLALQVFKVGGKAFIVESGVDSAALFLLLGLPQ